MDDSRPEKLTTGNMLCSMQCSGLNIQILDLNPKNQEYRPCNDLSFNLLLVVHCLFFLIHCVESNSSMEPKRDFVLHSSCQHGKHRRHRLTYRPGCSIFVCKQSVFSPLKVLIRALCVEALHRGPSWA